MFRHVLARAGLWFFGTTFVVWAFGERLGVIEDGQPLSEQLVVPTIVGGVVAVCMTFMIWHNSSDTK